MEKKMERALEIIEELDLETVECGKYVVDDDIYYMVQEYETKYPQEARYEAHQKYVDIQYIVKGVERMEFADTDKLKVAEAYNPEIDAVFLEDPKVIDACVVEAGDYRIFYPEDAHKPGLCVGEPAKVKKIVAKVRI
jgi:YhcH/YjgK/YiaL family protein